MKINQSSFLRSTSLRYIPVVIFLLIAMAPCVGRAQSTPTAYFAGVAFTGNHSDIPTEFPHLSRVIDATTNSRIFTQIRKQWQTQPHAINLLFDQLGDTSDAERSTALALAIDRETTSIERIGTVYKVRLEISMQLLFFNYKEKQILGGFPIILDYIDAMSTSPTDEQIQSDFEGMVLGTKGQHSLAGEFVGALSHISIPNPSTRHLRVTSVVLEPKAIAYLQQYKPGADQEIIRRQIAQEFGKYLAANQHMSILPFASNQALGKSMAASFANGDSFDLKIPDADYDISLDVAGFKKIELGRTNTSVGYLYGAFVDLTVKEPLSGKVYFSQRIKQGVSENVPVTQANMDDWTASYDTLRLLFNNFTLAISDPEGKWVGSALPPGSNSRAQLSSLSELVKSCR